MAPASRKHTTVSPPASTASSATTRSVAVAVAVAVIAAIAFVLLPVDDSLDFAQHQPAAITPFGPSLLDQSLFDEDYQRQMLWGSYRPQVYFGLRTRTPKSLLTGLMWSSVESRQLRHVCDHGDKLATYGWLQHDGETFGTQIIRDGVLTLATSFVKGDEQGVFDGTWSAKITATFNRPPATKNAKQAPSMLLFYLADESELSDFTVTKAEQHSIIVHGKSQTLGRFSMKMSMVHEHPSNAETMQSTFKMGHIRHTHNITEQVQRNIFTQQSGDATTSTTTNNFVVFQAASHNNFTLFVSFSNADTDSFADLVTYDGLLQAAVSRFEQRFAKTFGENKLESVKMVSQAALSNLLGGIGYFYGQSRITTPELAQLAPEDPRRYLQSWPAPLFTAVPSRSFFPRGFLWDEGFHQLLVSRWNRRLSMDILAHWLSLMNIDGFIPREQILGDEALSRVPAEFVTQRTDHANPPTLYLPLMYLLETSTDETPEHPAWRGSSAEKERRFFKAIYPRLETWYRWFNTTQSGPEPMSFRWRGRRSDSVHELNPKTLTSGLDDYPRASHPSTEERHVDLRGWMTLASHAMMKLSGFAGKDNSAYKQLYAALTDNDILNRQHWNAKLHMYCDYGLHTTRAKLERVVVRKQSQHAPAQTEMQRVVKQEPSLRFACFNGYVSLFPLLMRVLDINSTQLEAILHSLRNESGLWTKFGLRSLAKNSPLYQAHNTEHDPPYWRGAIWLNMNYLALSALHHYAVAEGPHQALALEVHDQLRNNILSNMVQQYQHSGYLWEQYHDVTGQGKGTHPFTGWSALFTMIESQSYTV